eukprot:m.1562147 g.1562147  ORF g.1562147 m.1562147 type:complete len:241 (-) comp25280_c1_seq6:7111-7833(-)
MADDSATSDATSGSGESEECVKFRVVYKKVVHDIEFGLEKTVKDLKEHLYGITNCPVVSQKLMYKGLLADDETLKSRKFVNRAKVLLVGPTAEEILATVTADSSAGTDESPAAAAAKVEKTKWCDEKVHQRVLDKGKPADAVVGYSGREPLPQEPILAFNAGGKVRLTFKLMEGLLIIGTNERTVRVPLGSIRDCQAQPIPGHLGYHILGLQLGPTSKSMNFFYWFPSQFVSAIKALLSQ